MSSPCQLRHVKVSGGHRRRRAHLAAGRSAGETERWRLAAAVRVTENVWRVAPGARRPRASRRDASAPFRFALRAFARTRSREGAKRKSAQPGGKLISVRSRIRFRIVRRKLWDARSPDDP